MSADKFEPSHDVGDAVARPTAAEAALLGSPLADAAGTRSAA
jgi:hypothetical protein